MVRLSRTLWIVLIAVCGFLLSSPALAQADITFSIGGHCLTLDITSAFVGCGGASTGVYTVAAALSAPSGFDTITLEPASFSGSTNVKLIGVGHPGLEGNPYGILSQDLIPGEAGPCGFCGTTQRVFAEALDPAAGVFLGPMSIVFSVSTPVPEPDSLILLFSGALGLLGVRATRRQKAGD